ncbi:MAG: hypothetical protein K9N35_12290 [Candidatus Marinimicrobia bacterium]|nr:hypothetical protein [Candidatus Neomarinimicrobiota bacterium]
MSQEKTDATEWAAQNKRNTKQLRNWAGAWCLTMALSAFGPKYIWDFSTLLTIMAIILNLGTGFRMIFANKKYLQGLDELQRKIQLEAMALALGVGLVVGLNYELLEDVRLITFQPEIPHLIILMSLTVFGGIVYGTRRYQ